MGPGRSARPRAARGRARSSRGPAAGLCRGHAGARPAGRPRRRRRAVHRRVGESAQRRYLSEPSIGAAIPRPATRGRAFRRDSVLERPNGDPARAETVQPGLHRFGEGTDEPYSVVWWDPAILALDQRAPMGVRHENLIGKGASRAVVDETLAAFRQWESHRETAIADGSRPSLRVLTASEWAAGDGALPDGAPLPDVLVEHLPGRLDAGGRPGTRFGALVHAVLASVALDADRDAVDAAARAHAAVAGSDAGGRGRRRRRGTPDAGLALGPARRHRTRLPARVAADVSDGADGIVEGVADLVFDEDGRVGGRRVQDRRRDRPARPRAISPASGVLRRRRRPRHGPKCERRAPPNLGASTRGCGAAAAMTCSR